MSFHFIYPWDESVFFFMVTLLGFVYGLLPNPEVKNIFSYILLTPAWILTDVKIFTFRDLWFKSSAPSPSFYYVRREHFNLGVGRGVRMVSKFSPWPICHLENSFTVWVSAQKHSPLWSLYKLPQLNLIQYTFTLSTSYIPSHFLEA